MSKPRILTDEQDKANADWWWQMQQIPTLRDKAKELGLSISALQDSIKRGLGQPTAGQRYKLKHAFDDVSRGTNKEVA